MICPACHGKGMVETGNSIHLGHGRWIHQIQPCPDCHGSGRISCCDEAGAGICEGGSPTEEKER